MLGLSLILTLLLSYTVVFVDLATANPMPPFPTLKVYSPIQNETYNLPHVLLNFSEIMPDAMSLSDNYGYYENLTSVYYAVDGGERQNITVPEIDSFIKGYIFSTILNLTAGAHNVQISDDFQLTLSSTTRSTLLNGYSELVNFTVVLPGPVIVASESITYNVSSVPLTFTADTSATSWVGYSLDGKNNVTIAGNTTLTGLSNREHNITVYTNDTFGNVATSQIVNFIVALPPVMQPFPAVTVAAVSGVAAVVAGAGLLIYFTRRRLVKLDGY